MRPASGPLLCLSAWHGTYTNFTSWQRRWQRRRLQRRAAALEKIKKRERGRESKTGEREITLSLSVCLSVRLVDNTRVVKHIAHRATIHRQPATGRLSEPSTTIPEQGSMRMVVLLATSSR